MIRIVLAIIVVLLAEIVAFAQGSQKFEAAMFRLEDPHSEWITTGQTLPTRVKRFHRTGSSCSTLRSGA